MLMATVMTQPADPARRADHRVDAAREVQERRPGERQAGRSERALDWTNERRLSAYRAALDDAKTLDEVFATAARLFEEDRESGHVTVVSQMIAGSVARPELAPETLKRMQPWLELCEQTLERVLGTSALAQALPTRDLAYAIVNFYLGANLLTHLEGDRTRADELLARLRALEPLASGLL